jgi:hypothetical protein
MIPSWCVVAAMLRSGREKRGIPVEEAARLYSVSVSDISHLELAGSCPGVSVIEYAETVLQMSSEDLTALASIMARGARPERGEC